MKTFEIRRLYWKGSTHKKPETGENLRVPQEPKKQHISILVSQGRKARYKVGEKHRDHTCRCLVENDLSTLNKGVTGSIELVKVSFWFLYGSQMGKGKKKSG